jgi:hypothetical protein
VSDVFERALAEFERRLAEVADQDGMVPIEVVERIRSECVAPLLRVLDRIERKAVEEFKDRPGADKVLAAIRARFDGVRAMLEKRFADVRRPH